MQEARVRLLWTGGWDSTFRLLCLLSRENVHIAPYYLLRDKRESTSVELATMERIRLALRKVFPDSDVRLAPTEFCNVDTLAQDPDITSAYERTLERSFLGRQYEWLAWFCTQDGIDEIELCVHRDDKAHAVLAPFTMEVERAAGPTHVFDPRAAGRSEKSTDLHRLFRFFSFPVFETTKREMAEQARANGWDEIMGMTWFCHSPRRNAQPCGVCHPCLYTIEEGLAWRLPRSSRIRSALFRTCLLPFRTPIVFVLETLGLRRKETPLTASGPGSASL
ncbi:hypothetical protein LF41_278 [Lysobacter dokdonensis DS-58]|uniref:7-cyano-7-deazaguanine synthase n=1 Tax=Lysobacter dokdonensis DS-58 TaxID=1300345 RepID=A0A0A2WKF9_9GAMM|nr:hypothetical protein [Lysobacter dokdonensis]KGQ18745.1 hypothetical protein LF41_278 [Lysobacter dokdonensis DS-58]